MQPSNYRDLPIHQRINAKANAIHFNGYYYRVMQITGRLLKSLIKRDANLFEPQTPYYVIQFKTDYYDPTPWETRY